MTRVARVLPSIRRTPHAGTRALQFQREALAAHRFDERRASSPNLGPFSRGSSWDGLPSAVDMSARRVIAMTTSSASRMAADNTLLLGSMDPGRVGSSPFWLSPRDTYDDAAGRRALA